MGGLEGIQGLADQVATAMQPMTDKANQEKLDLLTNQMNATGNYMGSEKPAERAQNLMTLAGPEAAGVASDGFRKGMIANGKEFKDDVVKYIESVTDPKKQQEMKETAKHILASGAHGENAAAALDKVFSNDPQKATFANDFAGIMLDQVRQVNANSTTLPEQGTDQGKGAPAKPKAPPQR